MRKATLILDDGTRFCGHSFGAHKCIGGEVVFNTAMTGYTESLTDPSYAGQIMVLNKVKSIIRISIASVIAIVAISFTSCQTVASSAIELSVEQANKECPMYIDEDITCDRIYSKGNNVIYEYTTTYDIIEGLQIAGHDYCKMAHYDELAASKLYDSDIETMIDLCIEAQYNMVYKYNDEYGNSFVVTITHQDLASM